MFFHRGLRDSWQEILDSQGMRLWVQDMPDKSNCDLEIEDVEWANILYISVYIYSFYVQIQYIFILKSI